MDNYLRLEELLIENKKLYTLNVKLKDDLSSKNKKLMQLQTSLSASNNSIFQLEKEIRRLESECKSKDKKIKTDSLFAKNEFRRKDILNNKLVGSNKNIKEKELKEEINLLYLRNNLLCEFIKDLFDKKDLDFNIFYNLLDSSSDINEVLNIFKDQLRE